MKSAKVMEALDDAEGPWHLSPVFRGCWFIAGIAEGSGSAREAVSKPQLTRRFALPEGARHAGPRRAKPSKPQALNAELRQRRSTQ